MELLIPADIRFPLERANGVQIVKTASALARAGARVTLVVRASDPRPTPEILALYGLPPHEKLAVRRLAVGHRQGSFAFPRALFLAQTVSLAAAALARGALVYTRDLQLADALLGLRRRARVAYEAHAVESVLYRERGTIYATGEAPSETKARRLARREGRVWKRAACFVSTTAGIRDAFAELYGARARAHVVPNGCDLPADGRFPGLADPSPARVLYAGQLYPWKGVDVLVEAMREVPEARLVILGGLKGEADFARVQAAVERAGLAARSELPGTRPQVEVADELRKASVVVAPFLRTAMTERHTSPIKAFEAMAAGRPIVASDLPSSREILRHGETALLTPPGDARALGVAIRDLLLDRARADRLARAAFEAAAAFSWDARAGRLLRAFEEVA
ncbi:MAG: glycosyltransferase [Vicinamibacteria bacterium]